MAACAACCPATALAQPRCCGRRRECRPSCSLPAHRCIGFPVPFGRLAVRWARRSLKTQAVNGPERKLELEELDSLLERGQEETAVALVNKLAGSGSLVAFGRGHRLPKRDFSLPELKMAGLDAEKLLSPHDFTLDGVKQKILLVCFLLSSIYVSAAQPSQLELLGIALLGLLALTADQIVAGGGVQALVLDTLARVLAPQYGLRVAAHEAGHFLVAYLLGIVPSGYTLSSFEAVRKSSDYRVQAGSTFCDGAFQAEVATGSLSSGSLDTYTTIALSGVIAEYIKFGQAEGGLADIRGLDALLSSLGFSQKKAQSQVRWAALQSASILKRHVAAHMFLADAMRAGASVGECICVIEEHLQDSPLV